ncbi:unnamed protein product [Owenia fusiformis]|uniref:Uncharacterized protein n=1 Tax=Owenia fusiformis TaxID=6347 RepID=A0A8J1UVT4_OWEFU|nr:unnamed protein product [Owenia fusiformis]
MAASGTTPSDLDLIPGIDDQSAAIQAYYLFTIAFIGVITNIYVVVSILLRKRLRVSKSAFLIHGCLLNLGLCLYNIPFAVSLISEHRLPPQACETVGSTFVIIVTTSVFNMVAIASSEAYVFVERNLNSEQSGSICCVIFSLMTEYIGSLILHLGPTIIGGTFDYNSKIGNCMIHYGMVKSYISFAMWVSIVTVAIFGVTYYLAMFYRHIKSTARHMIDIAMVTSQNNNLHGEMTIQGVKDLITNSLSRLRVLVGSTIVFVICWYPLYILSMVDWNYTQSAVAYRVLTLVACTYPTIFPIILIVFDRGLNICGQCIDWDRIFNRRGITPRERLIQQSLRESSPRSQRVGCRLSAKTPLPPVSCCNGGNIKPPLCANRFSYCEMHSSDV